MDFHSAAGGLAILGGLYGIVLYIRDTVRGITRPHTFTWFVWGLLTSIAAAVAYSGEAYASFWTLAVGGAVNLTVCALSLKYGEKKITRGDWAAFLSALAVIPLWVITKEALLAACLAALIDWLGVIPTFRKVWSKPHEENLRVFNLFGLTGFLSVLAIEPLTLTTGVYPISGLLINMLVVATILVRRRALRVDCLAHSL